MTNSVASWWPKPAPASASLSLCPGAIPVARLTQKKLVISTATVALQEQLIHKDLPFYHRHSELPFRFMLVKGRQRYCCEHLLEQAASGSEMANFEFDFGSLSKHKPSDADKAAIRRCGRPTPTANGMAIGTTGPNPSPISAGIASPPTATPATRHSVIISTALPPCPQRHGCGRCAGSQPRPAALRPHHGGGIILPPPDECIYVLDEAHHLPTIARDHGAASASVRVRAAGWRSWRRVPASWPEPSTRRACSIPNSSCRMRWPPLQPDLKALEQWLAANDRLFNEEKHCRFTDGVLPDPLPMLAENLKEASKKALRALDRMQGAIGEALKDGGSAARRPNPCWRRAASICSGWRGSATCGRCWDGTWHKAKRRWLAGWSRAMTATSGCMPPHRGRLSAGRVALVQVSWRRAGVGNPDRPLLVQLFSPSGRAQRARRHPLSAAALPFDYQKAELYLPKMEHEPSAPPSPRSSSAPCLACWQARRRAWCCSPLTGR